MYPLSTPKQKELDTCQNIWRRLDLHPSRQDWCRETIENYGFYGGYGQWDEVSKVKALKKGMTPLVVNIIQSFVDSLSGVEIQSRYRNAVRSDSGNEKDEELARALTHLLYFIQEDQHIPYQGSIKFRDMLVCGLGWSDTYYENGRTFYENIHPFNVLPDFDDLSPQFSKMKYVGRKMWTEPDVVKRLWPKVAKYIDFSDPELVTMVSSPELDDRNSIVSSFGNNSSQYGYSRVLVKQIQRKVPRKAYCGIDHQGFYFETFDEEKSEELANKPSDIEEKESTQIIRTLFLDNFLLETAPLNPNVPSLEDFSLIPCVWKRYFHTGVPYGLVGSMKDVQRDSNTRLTKALFGIDSSKLFITGNVPMGKDMNRIVEEFKRPDGVVIMPADCKFEIRDNNPVSDAQIKMFNLYTEQLQRVTGIYNDMLGQQTNATSGVAQHRRQINSVRNSVFGFDNFANMKKREAKFMLSLIQGGGMENVLMQVVTEEERESIILNLVRTIKGKKYVFNDIRTLPLSLQIEEVPDYTNTMEENKAVIESVMSNVNAPLILRSPGLMKLIGIRDHEKIANELKLAMTEDQQVKGSVSPSELPQEQQNLAYPGI